MATAATSLAEATSHNVRPDVFLKHYRQIRDSKDAHKDAGTAVARAKKAAKADGIDLNALKLLENLAKLDEDEVEVLLRHLQTYAGWVDLPLGTQGDMFGGKGPEVPPEAAAEQRKWEAGNDGYAIARDGGQRLSNPHDVGTETHVAWDKAWIRGNKAWIAGQKKIAKGLNGKGKHGSGEAAAP